MASASVLEKYAVYVYKSTKCVITKCVVAINTMLQADVEKVCVYEGHDNALRLLHKTNGCQ